MLTRFGIRAFTSEACKVIHDIARQQFTISCGRGKEDAVLGYCMDDSKTITFMHTNVPEACQGQGLAKQLAESAFKYAYEKHLTVVVKCDYLAKYYRQNQNKYYNLPVKIEV